MREQGSNTKVIAKLMLRLLPVQVLLAAVGAVNGIVSTFFASNFIGVDAMSAIGLYAPVNFLINAISIMLAGGSVIVYGKYLGRNEQEKMYGVFSLNQVISLVIAVIATIFFLALGWADQTAFLAKDAGLRPIFNQYLIGQAIGLIPFLIGNQLAAFLTLENRSIRTTVASLVYIGVNLLLNYVFVLVLRMDAFGLALASSLGMWVFMAVQSQYFLSKEYRAHLGLKGLRWGELMDILRIGLPGAASNGYQTLRSYLVNLMITAYVGGMGLSAFAAVDNLLKLVWAVPMGMIAVSRLMISVSVGEEDRQSLADTMRVMFRRYIPLMCIICAGIIACAVPLTNIYYHDPSQPVYQMTVWGIRILPLCMPLSIICMHFVCYGQASDKHALVHLVSLLDGVVCVVAFTALLIPALGMNSVYIANVLNGIVSIVVIVAYAHLKGRRFPGNMEELMVIPDDFGAPAEDRLDLSIQDIQGVVAISQTVQNFCRARGIDDRRAYLAGLALEEMAGNIVDHGFVKDHKKHSIDLRVVHVKNSVILRLRDDCVPFDPGDRRKMAEDGDPMKNIGIRMIFQMAADVQYRNILGLNVLTIRI